MIKNYNNNLSEEEDIKTKLWMVVYGKPKGYYGDYYYSMFAGMKGAARKAALHKNDEHFPLMTILSVDCEEGESYYESTARNRVNRWAKEKPPGSRWLFFVYGFFVFVFIGLPGFLLRQF